MQKILISGNNSEFKKSFLESLPVKKRIITFDDFPNSIKSTNINYYSALIKMQDHQFIEILTQLLYIHNTPHALIISVESYLLYLKELITLFNNNMKLLDAFIVYKNDHILKQKLKELLDSKTIDLETFKYYMNRYLSFHTQEFILIEMYIVLLFQDIGCPPERCSSIQLDEINQDVHLYLIHEINKKDLRTLILIEDHRTYNTQVLQHYFEMNKDDYPIVAVFKDVFLHEELISQISYLFDIKIYLNHNAKSANIISQLSGEVEICYTSKAVTLNKRIGSENFLDRLFRTDKTEQITTLAPVKEPKISKEEIMYLNKNVCLLQNYDDTPHFFSWSNRMSLLLAETKLLENYF